MRDVSFTVLTLNEIYFLVRERDDRGNFLCIEGHPHSQSAQEVPFIWRSRIVEKGFV